MANDCFTAVDPKVLSTPSPQGLVPMNIAATDGHCWCAGDLLLICQTTGLVLPIVSGAYAAADVYGIARQDQNLATSSDTVEIKKLVAETRLEMYIAECGADATAADACLCWLRSRAMRQR